MQQNIYSTTGVKNEPVLSYKEGTGDRESFKEVKCTGTNKRYSDDYKR